MQGILKYNENLKPYTSWRIGGPAEIYYRPKDLNDLMLFLQSSYVKAPLMWLGLGSNVLIRDGGVKGTVIHTQGALNSLSIEGNFLRAEAGVSCAKVAKFCAKHGLQGMEFFAGIPGTIGGALAMNAGAFGGETWQQVAQVETINALGHTQIKEKSFYKVAYRAVQGLADDEWFVAGYFVLSKNEGENLPHKMRALLKQRNLAQPIGELSCGSVFRNPLGHSAGKLIELSNLKGMQIGGAMVSKKHANFIININNAKARDVEALIAYIINRVWLDSKILLEPEVRILGLE